MSISQYGFLFDDSAKDYSAQAFAAGHVCARSGTHWVRASHHATRK